MFSSRESVWLFIFTERFTTLKIKSAKKIRFISYILFILYILALIYFMFFAESYGRTIERREYSYNLVLFKEIQRFWDNWEVLGTMAVLTNLVGNVVGFIPFGFILPVISKKRRNFLVVTLLSFQLSLFIETTQLVFKVGSFDVDDMLLNTIGGLLGYILFKICNLIRRKYDG